MTQTTPAAAAQPGFADSAFQPQWISGTMVLVMAAAQVFATVVH
ncbi:MAG TPA: hypothetical protein VLI06_11850 [Solimonas sp.]|nr:hypothetical protein [Solimonas sp.]